MLTSSRYFVGAAGLVLLLLPSPAFAQIKRGDLVVVVEKADLKTATGVLGAEWPGTVVKVEDVRDGKWLWTGHSTPGWLEMTKVVPLAQGEEVFSKKIEGNPKSPEFYNARGLVRFHKGEPDKAKTDFDKAIELEPKFAGAYHNRGVLHQQQNRLSEAMTDYNKALESAAKSPVVYNSRAGAWYVQGDYKKSIEDCTAALALNSRYVPAIFRRGLSRMKLGQVDQAIEDFNQVVTLNPQQASVYVNRGSAFLGKGNYQQALTDYTAAADLDPNDALAQSGIAWLKATCPKAEFRDGKQAVAIAEKAVQASGGKDWGILDVLAAAQAEAGDFKKAQETAQKAIPLAPAAEKPGLEARLKLYQANQPCRETP